MAITLAKAVREENSERRLEGDSHQATHIEKMGMLRQACSRLTDEHKINSVHLHETLVEEVAPQRSITSEPGQTEQVKIPKPPPAEANSGKEKAGASQPPG
jgi:hypothetical protein